jgi:hypothetical protein
MAQSTGHVARVVVDTGIGPVLALELTGDRCTLYMVTDSWVIRK